MKQYPLRLNLRHLVHFFFLGALLVVLLLVFQNCSEPLSEDDELASVAANAPFAFDATIDTIAHMSCSYAPAGTDRNTFWSFKVGAFNSGAGLRYTDGFIAATGGYAPEKRAQVLAQSGRNAGVKFQSALRFASNLNAIAVFGSNTQESYSYGNFSTALSDTSVALALPQQVSPSRVFTFGGRPLAAKLDVMASSASDQLRANMNTGGILLTHNYSKDEYIPIEESGSVLGKGYRLGFARPGHITTTTAINQLNSVAELELPGLGNSAGANWSCSTNHRFLILRRGDQGCGVDGTPNTPDEVGNPAIVAEARKVLPRELWAIDGTNRCIVPKTTQGNCYGGNTTGLIARPGVATTCDPASNTCPHYLSICKRL